MSVFIHKYNSTVFAWVYKDLCGKLFIKTIQWVFCLSGVRLPKSGFTGVSASTSLRGISFSFHLKTRNPSFLRTRKHSENPFRKSSLQVFLFKQPYFLVIHPVMPARTRCGGSKTTMENELLFNFKSLKSITMSGLTENFCLFEKVSNSSCRLSTYKTSG